MQRGVAGLMEVVVTDDGSADDTPQVVQEFARTVDFAVRFTTHPHTTFQLCRCRNEGVAASSAPYLLFLDGDCLLPPNHVALHLRYRRAGVVRAGNCVRLNKSNSARIDDDVIRRGEFTRMVPLPVICKLRMKGIRSMAYEYFRHSRKPWLIGNNVAIWRDDYVRVNGFDENFEGWGGEDDDLGSRVRRAGLSVCSSLRWTNTYHLWHPPDVTAPPPETRTRNWEYLRRKGALIRCRNGLVKRSVNDLRLRVIGNTSSAEIGRWLPSPVQERMSQPSVAPEIEIVFLPGPGKFSGQAECNLLVVTEPTPAALKLAKEAHVVVADCELPAPQAFYRFRLHEFPTALKMVA